jgi:hypothetical protein
MKGWECGCMLQFNAAGCVTWAYACTDPDPGGHDFDEWLKGLTQ